MKRLIEADSILQRDAIRARLERHGIGSVTADRDVSRKYTSGTLDLSLGAYSAMSPGFAIYVEDDRHEQAEEVLAQFLRETRVAIATGKIDDPWRRYFACSIFSLMMPGLMTLPATYHLVRAIRSGEKPRSWSYFGLATLCFLVGWAGVVVFLRNLSF